MMARINGDKIVRTNNPIFYQANKNTIIDKSSTSKSKNVLTHNKVSTKLEVNEEFFDMIAEDKNNSDIAIVAFVGSRKVGKSFLLDCLISYEEKNVNREMTRNAKPIINMPTKNFVGKNG